MEYEKKLLFLLLFTLRRKYSQYKAEWKALLILNSGSDINGPVSGAKNRQLYSFIPLIDLI